MHPIRVVPALFLLAASAACVDKLSEDGRACPCSAEKTCCFGECVADMGECTLERRIGLEGGTVTAPNGASLEVPFGAMREDTLIRMRSAPDIVLPDGIQQLGEAVILEPAGLEFEKDATLTMPYDSSRIPDGTEPLNVLIHTAMVGSKAFKRLESEVDSNNMQAAVSHFSVFVPAISSECPWFTYGRSLEDCGRAEHDIDGTIYGVECDLGDPSTSCRCLEDGATVRTVEAPCFQSEEYVLEVYRYECEFPCPSGDPPGGPPDAGTTATDATPL
jgi:hypothetical protein